MTPTLPFLTALDFIRFLPASKKKLLRQRWWLLKTFPWSRQSKALMRIWYVDKAKVIILCCFVGLSFKTSVYCRRKQLKSLRRDTSRKYRKSKKWTWKSEYEVWGKVGFWITVDIKIIFVGTKSVEMMKNGRRCWRKRAAQLSWASRGALLFKVAALLVLQRFNTVFTFISDKKRKLDGGNATATNGTPQHGKLKKEMQHGKFKKNKDKRGKFGKKP